MCGHAEGEMEDYVRVAIDKGLDEMGFSDHFPLLHIEMQNISMKMEELPFYFSCISALKEKFRGRIEIKSGLEVDYTPETEKQTRKILKKYNLDYVLGSCHFLGEWPIDHPDHIDEWKKRDVALVYKEYFQRINKMADTGIFDIIAHIDLVKKFGFIPEINLTNIYKDAALHIKKNNLCLEVNTSGLRKPVKEIYPAQEFLKICFDADVPSP